MAAAPYDFPAPACLTGYVGATKGHQTQCCAHRGYRAKFPENSLLAFAEAVKAGAQGLETDVHITRDEVVVLSHDATLERCFGRKDRIIDRAWDELKDVRTVAPPHVPMPRLADLLTFLTEPEHEDIWVVLDVKLINKPDDIMRLIAKTIAAAPPSPSAPWSQRVILGLWSEQHVPLAAQYLPGFPIVHIGVSVPYARRWFRYPNVGFNMKIAMLLAPCGARFVRECQSRGRPLLAWTVNDEEQMKWCIEHRLNGVMTDDPAKFVDLCDALAEGHEQLPAQITSEERLRHLIMWLLFMFFSLVLGGPVRMLNARRKLEAAVKSLRS